MTRYLVTGGTGFIGSHLVDELLDRGHEVTCLARPSARSEQMRVRPIRLIEGNLLDADRVASAVKGCDVVFHLAGLVKALKSETMHRTNVEGTRLLAAACAARSSPPALVMTSSLAAAGPSSNGQPRREVDHCQPVSVY
ncbi:MAG: NAD-dependent epimerase/dehydratase family protein, partial [Planctomycetota bacterium]|nr:NAD-dependent epimerase/dehydratase family protein [Planctomycetota bacterium]